MDDLVELKPLVEERPVELLVKLGLDSEGEKNFPRLCDNPPRKIPYYRLNQSTLVIKR
jgi:hypothetical protein